MSDAINILLVDDEPRNLDALEAILEDPGYRILRAEDADSALHALLECDVAAIVLDIKMPGMSGFELAKIIKGSKKFRQIPIVFLTAYLVDDQDVIAGYGAGAVDYLTKPANPQILRHKVEVFAELFRKTRALAQLNETLETRVQERTAELEQSEAALRVANKQKDLFLATLAHELRNPLAPLRTGLWVLMQQPDPSNTAARTLEVMNRQLDHMVRLVDDLLDVSRISRGTLEMRKEPVELGSVIERATETAEPLFVRRQQSVAFDVRTPVSACVDGVRIAQIVGNLLNNASKHSPQGATVRVELAYADGTAMIRVVDQGAGIPTDQLARVFDMFTKIERPGSGQNDGLGIGLALSRRLAELHGGTLTVTSAGEGRGATFTLSLPVEKAYELPPAVATLAAPPPSGPLRIVLVEDNEDSADMLMTWLRRYGHEVHVAHAGREGVALVLKERPDVVLCDIGLPGIDGVEVCRIIVREMPTPPRMVALTGWGIEEDRQNTAKAGFHAHLVKPVALDQLNAILQSVSSQASDVATHRPP